jgi:hypothetical protein
MRPLAERTSPQAPIDEAGHIVGCELTSSMQGGSAAAAAGVAHLCKLASSSRGLASSRCCSSMAHACGTCQMQTWLGHREHLPLLGKICRAEQRGPRDSALHYTQIP